MRQTPQIAAIELLYVMLSDGCVTPCPVQPSVKRAGGPARMAPATLGAVAVWAGERGLPLRLLADAKTAFAPAYMAALGEVGRVWLIPPGLDVDAGEDAVGAGEDAIVVMDIDSATRVHRLTDVVVLKYPWEKMADLPRAVRRLFAAGPRRIKLVMMDSASFPRGRLEEYGQVLEELKRLLLEQFQRGRIVELDALTDRLTLSKMNNCAAGEKNLTIVPTGEVWACPAFYLANEPDFRYGEFSGGFELPANKNIDTLHFHSASICQACDAYHCARCIYLNFVKTGEAAVSTRSHCLVANAERNASRGLLTELIAAEVDCGKCQTIPALRYRDPMEYCENHGFPIPGSKPQDIYVTSTRHLTDGAAGKRIAELEAQIAGLAAQIAGLAAQIAELAKKNALLEGQIVAQQLEV